MPTLVENKSEKGVGQTVDMDAPEYTLTIYKEGRGIVEVSIDVQMPESGKWVQDERAERGMTFELDESQDGMATMVNGSKRTIRGRVVRITGSATVWVEIEAG